MAIYVKLGEKANSFSDPITGVNLAGKEVIQISQIQANSPKTRSALRGGHLLRATSAEFAAFKKTSENLKTSPVVLDKKLTSKEEQNYLNRIAELESENRKLKVELDDSKNPDDKNPVNEDPILDFEAMSESELVAFYSENFEVSEKQIKAFEKLSIEKKIEELESLESEQ